MPTIQQLRYLVAISETLHFRRAAEACHVTQPTLSTQLKELEYKLGVQLVERTRSRVILTPIGERVVERGRIILREIDEIHGIAKLGQTVLESTIRIGVVQSLGSYFLPHIVPGLHSRFPKLGLYIREGLPEALLREIEEGGLDLLFFPLPVNRSDLSTLSVYREPILVVAPADHPLATADRVSPDMLRGETILALEPGHRLYEQVRHLAEDYGADLSHDFEGTSLDTLRQMVAMGMGISLMPALYVKSEVARQDIVVAKPFAGTPPSVTIGMVWRRKTARTEEFETLAGYICEILKHRAPEVTVLG